MSPAASVKNDLTQAGRKPASLRSPAYLSTTAPHLHMINVQNFWYLKMFFVIQTWQIYMKFRYIYLQTYLSKRVFFKLYIMWKDLTPRVFPLFSQCLPLYHCATLIHMIIGQNFWYLKLLFVIQTWQIYMNFRYIYLQTYDQKEWKDLTPRVFPLFSQCT
jgi:hypothetical protein